MNYYNEYDKHAAAWLRELITAGLIPAGHVDERSICDVQPDDLDGFCQVHLFAGIGGWSRALQLAGWPADRPAWSCSCPCQPFSCAGKGEAQADSRHLWPEAFRLIRECRPDTIFGEQVKAAIGFGWLDGISADLESEGYACGATVLGAHSVGAPHIRQRLYWVAQSQSEQHDRSGDARRGWGQFTDGRTTDNCGGLAHSEQPRLEGHGRHEQEPISQRREEAQRHGSQGGAVGGVGNAGHGERGRPCEQRPDGIDTPERRQKAAEFERSSETGGVVHTESRGSEPLRQADEQWTPGASSSAGFWGRYQLIPCRDGKVRRIPESGIFPLVNGLPAGMVPSSDPSLSEVQATPEGRVMRLKGYGNAIVPQVAAEFVKAFLEI